ncbi:hypothetical protein TNCV_526201 [Trichonephila clavipes]|nr:hypothetical protein TNCV_526201 [Trichonephila clavipes]
MNPSLHPPAVWHGGSPESKRKTHSVPIRVVLHPFLFDAITDQEKDHAPLCLITSVRTHDTQYHFASEPISLIRSTPQWMDWTISLTVTTDKWIVNNRGSFLVNLHSTALL